MINRQKEKFFLAGLMACFSFLLSFSQPVVRSSVDRSEILIGEQFKLKVEAGFSTDDYRVRWLSVPDSLLHFEVVSRSKIDSIYTDTKLSGIAQIITLTSFDSGKWILPSFLIGIDPAKGDSVYNYFTDSFPVTVSFSVSDTTNQLRDIKPIKEVESISSLWYWVGAGIVLLVIIFLIWFFTRKKKKPLRPIPVRLNLTAYDEAMIELKKLEQYNLSDPGEIKTVHSKLAYILKHYLSRRENDNYLNKTTGDLLILLKDIGVNAEVVAGAASTLRAGDAVKFARYLPDVGQTMECIATVKELIESFKPNHFPKPA